jgi:hypothetical protein
MKERIKADAKVSASEGNKCFRKMFQQMAWSKVEQSRFRWYVLPKRSVANGYALKVFKSNVLQVLVKAVWLALPRKSGPRGGRVVWW